MKLTKKLKSQSGLTIIEVMLSAVIFVIGFSVLVAMLGQMISKFSVPEIASADRIGQEMMIRTVATRDTTDLDTMIIQSEMTFRVTKHVVLRKNLAQASIVVYRTGNQKQVLHLYSEFETNNK